MDSLERWCNGKLYTSAKDSTLDGHHQVRFVKNGILDHEFTVENGKWNGTYREYYETGQPIIDACFHDGVIEGPYIRWHRNGSVESRLNLKDGHIQGLQQEFSPEGALVRRWFAHNDKIHGLSESWYPEDGRLRYHLFMYCQGELHGIQMCAASQPYFVADKGKILCRKFPDVAAWLKKRNDSLKKDLMEYVFRPARLARVYPSSDLLTVFQDLGFDE